MIQFIPNIARSAVVLTSAVLLAASLSSQAAVISVNYTTAAGQAITGSYGIASQGTEVAGWTNLLNIINATALPFADGTPSIVNLTGNNPGGNSAGNAAYAGTPLIAGKAVFAATPTNLTTFSNLNATFPNGYKVVVYLSGFLANRGASISDGTTTFYYMPLTNAADIAPALAGGLTRTTQTTDLGNANNPIAQYAVFGDPVPLTNDTLTLTLRNLYGTGGSYLGGIQIVGASATELSARVWKGNLNNNWDTSTLNWTNVFYGATNYAEGDPVFFTDAAATVSPTVNLTAARSPGSVTVDSAKNYTFTGGGIAGATGLSKKGSGTLTLSNPNTYTGNTIISAGTLKLGAVNVLPDGPGAGDVFVAPGVILDLNGNSEGINGLGGGGTVDNTGAAATLTVGLDNDGGTFPGTLQGALGLTKQGTNTLTWTGTSSHSGTTAVAQGTLALSPVSSFSGSSTLVVSNGATLNVSVTNGAGLFTSGDVRLNGGVALSVEYGNANNTASAVPIFTSGTLNLNGVSQIAISGTGFSIGTYTLISYGAKLGGGSISPTPAALPTGMLATIQDTGSAILLNVTFPSIQTLNYTFGDGGIWATNVGPDYWNLGTAVYTEYPGGLGDAVLFGTTYNSFPLSGGTVSLGTDVHPYSISASGSYTLTGPGKITGATGLQMAGAAGATLTLANTNTFAGVVTVTSGTLQINNGSALGSTAGGTVVATGASLAVANGAILSGEPLTLNGNGTASNNGALRTVGTNSPVTLAAPITLGSNARIRTADGGELVITSLITDNGSNYTAFLHAAQTNALLRLNSASNVAGNLTVYGVNTTQGTIRFEVNNVFPSASLTVGGGRHDLNGTAQTFAGLLAGFDPTLGVITNSSGTPATLTINYSATNTAQMQTALVGPINVVKDGTGLQSFAGGATVKHAYSGTTTINSGIFGVSSDFSGVTNSFTVNSGGTLRGSNTNTIGGPVMVNPGGTFYAGFASNQVGTLTISNNLTLGGDLIVAIDKDSSPSNDVVNVSGTLAYGGTLTILDINTNGTPFVVGDTFRVFKSGGSGGFSGINFISITNGAAATFSFSDGVLTVTSVGPVAQPTLNYTNLGGGVTQFSWTGAFKLQWQTNSAATGLGTNWVDYPNPANPVNVTNNPAIPAAFFRLSSL